MWIFSKAFKGTVDKIIANELQTRRRELDLSVAKLNSEYDSYKKSYEDKLSDLWIKLWECAYSKAVDSVWIILQKEMAHMVSLAEERSYVRAKAEFDDDLNKRIEGLKSLANTQTDIRSEERRVGKECRSR